MRYRQLSEEDKAIIAAMGQRMRAAREAKGLSRAQVAQVLGLADSSSVAQMELGRTAVAAYYAVRLADMLGISLDELFRG